jgi:hypothetical protein
VTVNLDITPGANATQVIDIDVAGTENSDVMSFDFAGAYTGDAINITTDNLVTGQAIVVDGSGTPQAAFCEFSVTGVPNGAGRVLECKSTGNASATNVGIAARFLETGAEQATSYCVQIDSTSNQALNVSTGMAHFAESATFLASNKVAVDANYVQAGGANNAITVAANADDTGTDIPLADGLRLLIDLNTLTLQAGANTLNYISGGAVSIVSHYDGTSNIGTAYSANTVIELVYSSGLSKWLDMSQ